MKNEIPSIISLFYFSVYQKKRKNRQQLLKTIYDLIGGRNVCSVLSFYGNVLFHNWKALKYTFYPFEGVSK